MRTILALTLLLPTLLAAQPLSWPPGGTVPSPLTDSMHLPDGRWLPSTKRWNLVFADQLVPNWLSDSQVAFAARHTVGTQKIWSGQAAQFRAINPNYIIVAYHLAAGLNPARNSDAPDPKSNSDTGFIGVIAPEGYVAEYTTHFLPWLAANGIAVGGVRYERMFQHYDSNDSAHRVWHQDPYWLMNVDNDDWRDYMNQIVPAWLEGNRNEGCFFDVAVETNVTLYNPKAANPAPRDFNWWQNPHRPTNAAAPITGYDTFDDWQNPMWLAYFRTIHDRFHTDTLDYLVIPNVDQMVTTVYDPTWLDGDGSGETVDGAMMESFGGYRGYDMWLTLERGVRHLTGRGKALIAQFGAGSAAERYRRVAMYMLIKNENSYLNIINGGGVEWYPEYEIDLGNQSPLPSTLDPLRVAGSTWQSLWRRDYANGMVLVNTGDDAVDYTLPAGSWRRIETSGGGAISADGTPAAQSITRQPIGGTVSVAGGEGMILVRDDASDAPERYRLPTWMDLTFGG